ncbi:hypothetical protein CHAD_12205 [Corynebacterium hadale]|uniref:Transposase n=1 Tax=Corynebacterium hadale TaxID=2026255 RepID=A0A269PBI6_9CORY|nr:hypothetical protein CIG21_09360 [Corynebacterium hadale]WKC61276.1 hypothetical protein CHAD_12205 [Corynebacterium hadale]
MIRFQFVYDHRAEYSVKRMCDVLELNRSSFYKWVSTRKKRRFKMYSDAVSVVLYDWCSSEPDKAFTAVEGSSAEERFLNRNR